jgi:hypothetical protein
MLSGRESGSEAGDLEIEHALAEGFAWRGRAPAGLAEILSRVSQPGGGRGGSWPGTWKAGPSRTMPSCACPSWLLIVANLATDWGIAGGPDGRTAWLELGGS